jgi:hypothetical protein
MSRVSGSICGLQLPSINEQRDAVLALVIHLCFRYCTEKVVVGDDYPDVDTNLGTFLTRWRSV